jgi:hypothetical protein
LFRGSSTGWWPMRFTSPTRGAVGRLPLHWSADPGPSSAGFRSSSSRCFAPGRRCASFASNASSLELTRGHSTPEPTPRMRITTAAASSAVHRCVQRQPQREVVRPHGRGRALRPARRRRRRHAQRQLGHVLERSHPRGGSSSSCPSCTSCSRRSRSSYANRSSLSGGEDSSSARKRAPAAYGGYRLGMTILL